jgi:hypothetical protein
MDARLRQRHRKQNGKAGEDGAMMMMKAFTLGTRTGSPSPFPDSILATRVVSSLAFWLGAVVFPFETAEILEVKITTSV